MVRIGETQIIASVNFSVGTAHVTNTNTSTSNSNSNVRGEVDVVFDYAFHTPPQHTSATDDVVMTSAEAIQGFLTKTFHQSQGTIFDLRTLHIANHLAWKVTINLVCLNYDGNVLDAAMLAAVAALTDSSLPGYSYDEDGLVNFTSSNDNNGGNKTCNNLQLVRTPISLTIGIFNDDNSTCNNERKFIVDPTAEEEAVLSGSVTVLMSAEGMLLDVLKCGGASFSGIISAEELAMCMQLGIGRAKEVSDILCGGVSE